MPWFRQAFPSARITCLDVSRKSLELGRSRFADAAKFVHFDGSVIPFPADHFDLVFLACVLHHIAHDEHGSILTELLRVLRPAGRLVIFEHNPWNPLAVHAVNTCPFDEHARLVRPGRLRDAVKGAGYADTSLRFRLFFPRALRALRPIERGLGWLPLGAQYRIAARKPPADAR